MSSEEISSSLNANGIISKAAKRVEEINAELNNQLETNSTSGQTSKTNDPVIPKKKISEIQRCQKCRKKVGLIGVACRCGNIYCAIHRYTNEHDCSFDYRALGAEEIKKNNPPIVADKVSKI